MRKRFSWKPFTSFLVLCASLVILLTGAVLYVAPAGRIANWTHWMLGPLDKEQWQALHTVFALLFVIAAALHLVFNWRVLLSYLRTRLHTGTSNRREFAAASAISALVLGLTLADVPPFATVMAVGEWAKNSWVSQETEPPVPHAEGLTLARLADVTGQPLDQVVRTLDRAGVRGATGEVTVGELAARNGLTPQQLYARARATAGPMPVNVEAGLGRKTVAQVCEELGIALHEGLRRLDAAGLPAKADDTMKGLAGAHGRTPHDVLPVLRGPAAQAR